MRWIPTAGFSPRGWLMLSGGSPSAERGNYGWARLVPEASTLSSGDTSQAVKKKNHKKKKPKKNHTHLNRYPRQLKKMHPCIPLPFLFGKKIEKNKPNAWPLPSGINPLPPTLHKKLYSYGRHSFTSQTIKVKHTVGKVGFRQNKGAEDRWSLHTIDRCWGWAHIPLAQNLKMWRKKIPTRQPLLKSPVPGEAVVHGQ